MPRGKGFPVYACYCRNCRQMFKAKREDALTCSPRCRKAWNRLMGGSGVTDQARGPVVYRVLLNGRHQSSHATREEAERAVAGWLEEFDGEFTIAEVRVRQKRDAKVE